jgi:RNA polymerase sigma-70 factor (ECF subfamily)
MSTSSGSQAGRSLHAIAAADVGQAAATPRPSTDHLAELLERSGRADAGAYEQLYNGVSASVYGVALRVVRNEAIAAEVAQEALVDVWHRAATYRREAGSPRAWIMTIAHRRAVDRVRSEQAHTDRLRNHGSTHEVDSHQQDTVVDAMYAQWEAARVRAGLQALTERQREALELTYFQGFTHQEAAEALDVPLGTAKARIRDGLIKLRDVLGVER